MKIALCIPVHGDTKAQFTYSLARLLIHSRGMVLFPFIVSSASIPVSRTQLAAEALHWGADWLLWMDADHKFPENALERLLAHHLPVVGCNYPRRRTGKPSASIETMKESGGIEPADFLGMGLCLISSKAMRSVPAPQFDARYLPSGEFQGEDVAFFRGLKEAGFQPYIDHDLSKEVGHIAETVLMF